MEKKYQEQIKLLQSQLDRERDMFYNQSDTQTQKLESELGVFKDEEYKLKDRVLIMSKVCALCIIILIFVSYADMLVKCFTLKNVFCVIHDCTLITIFFMLIKKIIGSFINVDDDISIPYYKFKC